MFSTPHHDGDQPLSPALTRRAFILGAIATAGAFALAACGSTSMPRTGEAGGAAATEDVRMVVPPKLDTAYLGKKIYCYRPLRHGSPNLSVEVVGDQVIAHDYGHGGSGWTLGPGAAAYVVDLVQKDPSGAAIAKDEPVTVVGAGVIGLFTAYELVKRGYTDVTVVAESFEGLTSDNAAGLLAPVSMDNDPAMQKVVDKIGEESYRFFADIAKGTQADFKTGASIMPAYFENREESGLEPYVGVVMEPAKDVVLDFGNGTRRPMVAYDDGVFIDPAVMMKSLRDLIKDNVTFEQRKVTSFASLPSKLVFNCTGLGAAELNNDPEMESVQGHLVMLRDQTPAELQYMILVYFDKDRTPSGQEVKRSFYIIPKRLLNTGPNDVGVIGGTFIKGGTPDTPNDEEFAIMLDGARRFYGV